MTDELHISTPGGSFTVTGVWTPSDSGPPPVAGLKPSLPDAVAALLQTTPALDERFTAPDWGGVWSNTWFRGNNFNGMPLDPTCIEFLSGGGVKLNVKNGGRTGCFMVTNPNNGDCHGFEFRYGYDESEAIIPANAAWPSLWNTGQSHPQNGEQDVVEVIQSSNQFSHNYHDANANGSERAQNSGAISGSWAGQRVIYGGIRLPDGTASGYWNGKLVKTWHVNDQGAPHYLINSIGDKDRGGAGGMIVYRRTVWLVK